MMTSNICVSPTSIYARWKGYLSFLVPPPHAWLTWTGCLYSFWLHFYLFLKFLERFAPQVSQTTLFRTHHLDEYCPAGWAVKRRKDGSAWTCDLADPKRKCEKPFMCIASKCGLKFCCANESKRISNSAKICLISEMAKKFQSVSQEEEEEDEDTKELWICCVDR